MKQGQTKKNIRLLSHNDLNGFGNGGQIVVSRIGKKRLAFVSHMKGKAFSILDVRDSSKPEVLYQHEAYSGTLTHKVRIYKDRYLLLNCERAREGDVSTFDYGFRIFDLKDVLAPKEISYAKVEGRGVHRFWVDEEKEWALLPSFVNGFDGRILLIYDIKDVNHPKELARWWFPGQRTENNEEKSKAFWLSEGRSYRAHGPPIRVGNRIYLGYWDAGSLILDSSDPRNISIISQRNLSPPYGGCTHTVLPITREIKGRKWLIVTDESMAEYCREGKKLLWIMDASEEKNIIPVSTYSVTDDGFCRQGGKFGAHNVHEDMSLPNDEIHASWFSAGVRVIDVSNPYVPNEVAYYIPTFDKKKQKVIQTNDIFVDDRGLIFTIDRISAGVHILERTDRS
ncbi:MAG: hypothetical protein PXY39_11970 [archaeon]|nr:hypothetical protein [archaeon]